MDQRLPSGSTVLVLSTKNATRFPKKTMENATVSSAGTFWRGIRAEKTQKHRLPPSSDETQALFGSSSDQTLEALLERTAGREGLAVLP